MGTLLLFAHPLHNFLLTPGQPRSQGFSLKGKSPGNEVDPRRAPSLARFLACSISPPRKKERKRLLRRLLTPRNFFLFCFAGEREGRRESLRSRLFPTLATVARFLALGTVIILQLARVDYPRPPPPTWWWV